MATFQYRKGVFHTEEQLNALGAEGWELVDAEVVGDAVTGACFCVLKKRID